MKYLDCSRRWIIWRNGCKESKKISCESRIKEVNFNNITFRIFYIPRIYTIPLGGRKAILIFE